MATTTKKDYITFSNGINTETNYIKEEEGTCSEISNFKINKDGSLQKRGGLLPAHPFIDSISATQKPQAYLWKNVAGNPDRNFYVIKQGMILHFFNANETFNTSTKLNFSVDLNGFTTPGYSVGTDFKVKMIDGEGYLFVASKVLEPIIVKFNEEKKVMEANTIELKIRDYVGLEDGIKNVTDYPVTYNNSLVYNLTNQGFSESDIAQFFTENGFLPSKTDIPRNFKYIKVSTDIKDPKKPVEVYDYQLSIENNFGTSKAPIGRKLLDVFKRDRKIGSSKISFAINRNTIFGWRANASTTIITFKANRVPDVPLNSLFDIEVKQTGFDVPFPPPSNSYSDTMIGHPVNSIYTNPMVVAWSAKTSDLENKSIQIFEDVNAPWDAHVGMSEAEYKAARFRIADCVMARNTGDNNEYVFISKNDRYIDFIKGNLIDVVGGTVTTEFDLSTQGWNLTPEETGKYIKITTNAKVDNLYHSRRITYDDFPNSFWYTVTVSTGTGAYEDPRTVPTINVKSIMSPSPDRIYNGKIRMKFISEDLAELHIGTRLTNIDENFDLNNPLPVSYNSYSYNSRYDNGTLIRGLDEILSQLSVSYVISDQPVDVAKDEESYRPETIAFYANRLFYSSYNSDKYSNHIFYSQMQDLEENVGKCYSKNDPTSEFQNQLLDTDGGYISLPEADNIQNLVVVKDKLLVLSRNSVYAIFGDPFFKATSYAVTKVADIGIVSPDAYAIVGETIVFASDDGLYNFNIDELSGDLLSNNFSNQRIKTLYNSLNEEQKKNIKLEYNPFEKKLSIMLNKDTALAPYIYDTILHYDFDLQAFYAYEIDQYQNYQIIDFFQEYVYNKQRPNSLFVYDNVTGHYGTLVENENEFKDFSTTNNKNITCALETNYINFNDVMRTKQVRRLQVYADNEQASQCNAFIKYDSSIVPSKKWSKSENIFRLQSKTNGEVHMHQQVCRGEGLFFKLRLESDEPKPCKILGWTLLVEGNQQV